MNLFEGNEYQKWVATKMRKFDTSELTLLAPALGLCTEAGEAGDIVKKHVLHNRPASLDAIRKELGDVLFYLAAFANAFSLSLTEICQANYMKLEARYPDGFDPARAHSSGEKPAEEQKAIEPAVDYEERWNVDTKEEGCSSTHYVVSNGRVYFCDAKGTVDRTAFIFSSVSGMLEYWRDGGCEPYRCNARGRRLPSRDAAPPPSTPGYKVFIASFSLADVDRTYTYVWEGSPVSRVRANQLISLADFTRTLWQPGRIVFYIPEEATPSAEPWPDSAGE